MSINLLYENPLMILIYSVEKNMINFSVLYFKIKKLRVFFGSASNNHLIRTFTFCDAVAKKGKLDSEISKRQIYVNKDLVSSGTT
jgi:hypothetical protein